MLELYIRKMKTNMIFEEIFSQSLMMEITWWKLLSSCQSFIVFAEEKLAKNKKILSFAHLSMFIKQTGKKNKQLN